MSSIEKKIYKKKNWKQLIIGNTIYQKILRIYLFIVAVGAVLLALPSSKNPGKELTLFEAFFTAISAFTNTGLTVKATADTFNFFGQFVIMVLIQTGGMGFLTILILLWVLFRKNRKVTVEHRLFLHWERGSHNKVESLDSVKTGIAVLLIAELVGAYLLTIFFFSASPSSPTGSQKDGDTVNTKGDIWRSLWHGIFHAVSAANNAGFDLLGKHSIIPYRNGANNFLSVVLLLESVVGGIGYPIFHEIKNYFSKRKKGEFTGYSLSFRLGTWSYFMVAVLGACAAVSFEVSGSKIGTGIFSNKVPNTTHGGVSFQWSESTKLADQIWNVIYLSFSSRSSGFSSINIWELTESTRCLLSVLMFIGANPASTGGGIRTVTIVIILARFWYTARGKTHLSIFKKTIPPEVVHESSQVFILSTILVMASVFILVMSSTGNVSINNALFEASSAFGTAGLTSGITAQTRPSGRIALMLLMLIGQLGVSNALVSITDVKSKPKDCEWSHANLRIA